MLHSASELLNDLESVQISLAGTQCSQLNPQSQKQRKEFTLHFVCIQGWFSRCSWLEKLNTLTRLLQGLKTLDSLSLILNVLVTTSTKTTIYGECQQSRNFIYDKKLQDHNRSLHDKSFKVTQEADIEWFNSLEEDYEQLIILMGLLRVGGGSVMYHVFQVGKKLYNQRLQESQAKRHSSLVVIKTPTEPSTVSNPNLNASPKSQRSNSGTKSHVLSIKPANVDEGQKRDPLNPYTAEVERLRKAWHDKIKKYRIQVEGRPPSAPKKGTKGGKKGKDKGSKSSKSEKDNKGKKGKEEGEELDYIQLLPIWVVKKIFNYLDAKTLKKIKAVNKYWSYAITDLQKDQKTRKFLNKFISKLEGSGSKTPTEQPLVLKPIPVGVPPKRRLQKLWERGAVHSKLRVGLQKPLIKRSLVTEATQLTPGSYLLPLHILETFPRNYHKGAPSLFRRKSWIVNELGFIRIKKKPAPISDTVSRTPGSDSSLSSKKSTLPVKKSAKESGSGSGGGSGSASGTGEGIGMGAGTGTEAGTGTGAGTESAGGTGIGAGTENGGETGSAGVVENGRAGGGGSGGGSHSGTGNENLNTDSNKAND